MDKVKKKTLMKALRIAGNTLLWLFVVFSVLVTILVFSAQGNDDGLPNIGGVALVNVLSDSMKGEDGFSKGALIFDRVVTDEEKLSLKVGDVITFFADLNGDGERDEINSHRIVDIVVTGTEEAPVTWYYTQGDNNLTEDSTPVNSVDVLGVWNGNHVAGVGAVISFLQTRTGFLVVIVLPLVLFFLFELYRFIMIVAKLKKPESVSESEKEEIKRRAIEEYIRQTAEADKTNRTGDTAGESDETK